MTKDCRLGNCNLSRMAPKGQRLFENTHHIQNFLTVFNEHQGQISPQINNLTLNNVVHENIHPHFNRQRLANAAKDVGM